MWSRDHTWSSTSAVSSTPSKGRLREQFVSFVSAQHSLDKPARLTIRVLWSLFLIVRRVPRPSESGCKNSIGLKKYLLGHLMFWKRLSALMYLCTPLWCPSFHFKFITKCLKRPQRWRGFHSLPQNGGRICFGVLSYFILKGNWHLKLRINCLKMGEVFLSKWSHITSSCDINIYRSVMGALSH